MALWLLTKVERLVLGWPSSCENFDDREEVLFGILFWVPSRICYTVGTLLLEIGLRWFNFLNFYKKFVFIEVILIIWKAKSTIRLFNEKQTLPHPLPGLELLLQDSPFHLSKFFFCFQSLWIGIISGGPQATYMSLETKWWWVHFDQHWLQWR